MPARAQEYSSGTALVFSTAFIFLSLTLNRDSLSVIFIAETTMKSVKNLPEELRRDFHATFEEGQI
jgi:hypothetical protein